MQGWQEVVAELTKERKDHIIINLVEIKGSAPQEVGSKLIVTDDGYYWGTVGGGKIEAHCISFAKKLLETRSSSVLKTWNLQSDIGMSCGGVVSMYFDANYFSHWTVGIFGAGHISQELCRVMQTWSCQIKVFDTRLEWIEKLPKSQNIEKKLVKDLSQEVLSLPQGSFLLSMTQGHATDLPVLEKACLVADRFSYMGVIGSEVKAIKLKKELKERDIPEKILNQIRCPMGMKFGNNTPPEIAISIAAEILSIRA